MIIVTLTNHEPKKFGKKRKKADEKTLSDARYMEYLAKLTAEVHNRDNPKDLWEVKFEDDYKEKET